MIKEKFIKNKASLITLIAASLVVLLSLGVRQTFGLFFMDFNSSLSISNTEFGLAIGIQMLMWGINFYNVQRLLICYPNSLSLTNGKINYTFVGSKNIII